MRLTKRLSLALGCIVAAASPARLLAQRPANWPYPNVNKPVAIGTGDTVQVLNFIILEPGPNALPPGRRFDVQYASRIDVRDSVARHAQADRAAAFFGPQALQLGARRLSIALCDTRSCGETFEAPRVWNLYAQDSLGRWQRATP